MEISVYESHWACIAFERAHSIFGIIYNVHHHSCLQRALGGSHQVSIHAARIGDILNVTHVQHDGMRPCWLTLHCLLDWQADKSGLTQRDQINAVLAGTVFRTPLAERSPYFQELKMALRAILNEYTPLTAGAGAVTGPSSEGAITLMLR